MKKWQKIHLEWKGSGQTQARFCAERGIKLQRLKTEICKLIKLGVVGSSSFRDLKKRQAKQGFVKLEAEKQLASTRGQVGLEPYCIINFPGRGQVIVESAASLGAFRDLVQGVSDA